MLLMLDMHVHSECSFDSTAKLADILKAAKSRGLSGVAIADHDFFKMPEIPEKFSDMIVIPACEYSTDMGHTLVYFLTEDIAANLPRDGKGRCSFSALCEKAHAAGALVFLAHPYAPYFERPESDCEGLDGIEAYNARIEHSRADEPNIKAQELARKYSKAFSAGSDAHFPEEVGYAYWRAEIPDGADILPAIKQALLDGCGEIFGGRANPALRVKSQKQRMKLWGERFILPRLLPRYIRAFMRKSTVAEPKKISFKR